MSNGFVFYAGPSMIDGQPIVAILTGLEQGSRNTKTGGGLYQTWILRADMSPVEATHKGADISICGDCPHRGTIVDGRNVGRSCYVTVFQAPLVVWKAWRRGVYPAVAPDDAAALVAGGMVRLGAYGDPAAVPFAVWDTMLANVRAKAGYTHQWRNPAFAAFATYCMASCDTVEDFNEAKALGWRTFRVRAPGEALAHREIGCPASHELGQRTTCGACRACGGHSAKARVDITIIAHGAAGKVNAYTNRIAA